MTFSGSINDSDCYTVVQNSGGNLVGQLVGDCVELVISDPLAASTNFCVSTIDAISRNPGFTVAGVGVETSSGVYSVLDVGDVTVVNGKHCFDVTESINACPILHVEDYENVEENVDGVEGCGFIESIVEVVELIGDCEGGDQSACDLLDDVLNDEDEEDEEETKPKGDSEGLGLPVWIGIGVGSAVVVLAGMYVLTRGSSTPALAVRSTKYSSPSRGSNGERGRGRRNYDDDATYASDESL